MTSQRHRASRLASTLLATMGGEAGGGLILISVAVAAMLVANSPLFHAYEQLFHGTLGWTPIAQLDSLHRWINDGLMAIFFFVVGLELKREILSGELADPRRRRLPVIAALAGMAVPAICFLLIAGTALPLQRGWAIPGATDIAFAMGVVALLGSRVPPSLRLFLLTVAIVDDLGAVAIIALFYTSTIALGWLLAALPIVAGLILLGRMRITASWPYVLLSVALWFCVLHSGVHATVAGVAAALTIPLKLRDRGTSPLLRFEHALVPWNGYLIVPLFGFVNAGVPLGGGLAMLARPLPTAVAVGLLFGKQIGVFGAILVAKWLGFAAPPQGASWLQIWGIAALCGIGFTMSLFIGGLAFADYPELYEEAKLGIVAGSLLSMILGFVVLRCANSPPRLADL